MHRSIAIVVLGSVFAAGFVACEKRSNQQLEATPMTVFPAGASPGMIVRISAPDALFKERAPAVKFGETPAIVSRVIDDSNAEVLVPNLAAGVTRVTVASAKGATHAADFTVLPAHTQQLILEWKDGKMNLLAVHPTSGEASGRGEIGGEPQLSFDVVNEAGAVVYTGTIPNPIERRMEVFEGAEAGPAALHREKMGGPVVFALKVPKLAGEARVKFFEAPAGVNLLEAKGREIRKPIGELSVKGGQ